MDDVNQTAVFAPNSAENAVYAMLLDETARARGQAEYLRGVSPATAIPALDRYIAVKDEQIALLARYLNVPAPRTQPVYVPGLRALVVSDIAGLERIQNAYDEAELPAARIMLNQLLRLQTRALVALMSLL